MKTATIEELAYILKQAKENNQPKPIFFLGAGFSKSGDIPLASDIVKDILKKYVNAPAIKNLKVENRRYSELMNCLQPYERDKLLKGYIDKAKINVSHIYLAQLIYNNYTDYILTVNFDNLTLRALSLFNTFPSTYDMAILKDLTTTTFKEKSVVFLHGQHHGLWLLNTEEEMDKVKATVPRIFDTIKNKRPWVFIGYSGDDPIFEHVKNLGRFDNGLYWVTYNNNNPSEKVKNFLQKPNTNAFIIKGYDSDSFMLKLNSELELDQPKIINKPFTSIGEMLNNIVDIDDDDHFKGVKERLEISKDQVFQAIKQFEKGEIISNEIMKKKLEINLLKKDIINLIINEEYSVKKISEIESKAKLTDDKEVNNLLSNLFSAWGNNLGYQANLKKGKNADILYKKSFDKLKKSLQFIPNKSETLNNWGKILGDFARTKPRKEAEVLYQKAFEKFKKAIEHKSDQYIAFLNWGTYLGSLARITKTKEADALYQEAFQKLQKCIEIKPDHYKAFNSWGTYLGVLAKTKSGKEVDLIYREAFDKFKKSLDIEPKQFKAFLNWGNYLGTLAANKEGKEAVFLYEESFEKYQKAIDVKPDKNVAYYNWGCHLMSFAKMKHGKEADTLYQKAFKKLEKGVELGSGTYNLSCIYALRGGKENALKFLDLALSKNEIEISFISKDEDWDDYRQDNDFIELLNKYKE